MAKKKTLTVNNRTLLRQYKLLRDKLIYGEVDRIIIPVNGKKLYMAVLPAKKHVPGDIRPLLEKIKKDNPYKDLKFIRPEWSMKNLKLMERLWDKK
ncbi:hypothetical protein HZA42_03960 [Candidatus Peregrinibacteria bacterium]|nr:hypothetical protein [Candidatus Peregrinibacteria bacterium]